MYFSHLDPKALYTLYLVTPDVPSRFDPLESEWQLWSVHNIPGDQIDQGDQVVAYSPEYDHQESKPIKRIVALIYKQPGHWDVSQLSRFNSTTLRFLFVVNQACESKFQFICSMKYNERLVIFQEI